MFAYFNRRARRRQRKPPNYEFAVVPLDPPKPPLISSDPPQILQSQSHKGKRPVETAKPDTEQSEPLLSRSRSTDKRLCASGPPESFKGIQLDSYRVMSSLVSKGMIAKSNESSASSNGCISGDLDRKSPGGSSPQIKATDVQEPPGIRETHEWPADTTIVRPRTPAPLIFVPSPGAQSRDQYRASQQDLELCQASCKVQPKCPVPIPSGSSIASDTSKHSAQRPPSVGVSNVASVSNLHIISDAWHIASPQKTIPHFLNFEPSPGTPYSIRSSQQYPLVYHTQETQRSSSASSGVPGNDETWNATALKTELEAVRRLISKVAITTAANAQNSDSNGSNQTKQPSDSGSSHSGSKIGSTNQPNGLQRNKRYRRRNEEDHDEDQSDSDSQRQRKRKDPSKGRNERRLKCPYFQRRPGDCRLGSCRGQGFTEMAKLKDHLKRVHLQPLRCTRCWEEVQIYDQHFRQEVICNKQEEPYDRRISPLKLQELKFNRPPFSKDQAVAEKWTILYRILFPDEQVMPSPYEEYDMSAHMERLLISSLEEEILKELGDVLGEVIEIVRQRLPNIVAHCKKKAQILSQSYSRDSPSSPYTPMASSSSSKDSVFDKPEASQNPALYETNAECDDAQFLDWTAYELAKDFDDTTSMQAQCSGTQKIALDDWGSWEPNGDWARYVDFDAAQIV